jgi:hypothetical protein
MTLNRMGVVPIALSPARTEPRTIFCSVSRTGTIALMPGIVLSRS